MADNEPELEIKPKAGKKKLIIMLLAAVVLLGAIGGGAWFFLFSGGDKEAGHGAEHPEQTEEQLAAEKEAFYIRLPRAFVFNATGNVRDRLVQIKAVVLARGPENEALAKQHSPLIEGALLRIFSRATVEQLSTVEGKQKLKADAVAEVTKTLKDVTGKPVIEQVLFIGFVMQ